MKSLYECIMYVCETAVGVLADSEKFPSSWLFNYRWDKAKLTRTAKRKAKGKKHEKGQTDTAVTCLPNSAKIAFITVGGRTSCIVPSVQHKNVQHESDKEVNDNRSGNRVTRTKTEIEDKSCDSIRKEETLYRKRKKSLEVPLPTEITRKSPRLHKNSSQARSIST